MSRARRDVRDNGTPLEYIRLQSECGNQGLYSSMLFGHPDMSEVRMLVAPRRCAPELPRESSTRPDFPYSRMFCRHAAPLVLITAFSRTSSVLVVVGARGHSSQGQSELIAARLSPSGFGKCELHKQSYGAEGSLRLVRKRASAGSRSFRDHV